MTPAGIFSFSSLRRKKKKKEGGWGWGWGKDVISCTRAAASACDERVSEATGPHQNNVSSDCGIKITSGLFREFKKKKERKRKKATDESILELINA